MDSSVIIDILKHPNENGFVVFVLGILFVLTIYHFLLFFQHKDKSYLYYSLFTGLIFLSNIAKPTNGFINTLSTPIANILHDFHIEIIWLYNMLYFIFAFTFLDIKSFSKKWYSFIFRSIYVLFFICVVSEIVYRTTGNWHILTFQRHHFFIAYLSVLGVITYVALYQMKTQLKYYIIVGSIFLFSSSLIATFIHGLNLVTDDNEINHSIFYIGVILENILFSLGLGHKQKMILIEKRESQEKLIDQLQENEKLRSKIHEEFEKDIASLSRRAESEKLETLKVRYEKELSDLKMASLRSQMNPHFIFNSLNSIKLYIIDNQKENAVYYLNKFSKLIRKILATTREKEISLADEIETMELYLNIENIRFNNEIDFSVSVDKSLSLDTIKIPGLILQPFIENAIWHGLSSKKENRRLELIIEGYNKTHIQISIVDNGIGREKSAEINRNKMHKKRSIGIKLTEERLRNFAKEYINNYDLSFTDLYDEIKNANGTLVVLMIPVK